MTRDFKRVVGLGIFLILLFVIVVWQVINTNNEQKTENTLVFKDLADNISSVSKIEISSTSNPKLIIEKRANHSGWVASSNYDFPVKQDAVKTILYGLSRAAVLETKTKNPDLYASIGVNDLVDPNSKATQIIIKDANDEILLNAYLGLKEQLNYDALFNEALYLRKYGQEQSLLVKASLLDSYNFTDVAQEVLDLSEQRDSIEKITVNQKSSKLELIPDKNGTGDFNLITNENENAAVYLVNQYVNTLTDLKFNNVLPRSDFNFEQINSTIKVKLNTGVVLQFTIGNISEQSYVKLDFVKDTMQNLEDLKLTKIKDDVSSWFFKITANDLAVLKQQKQDFLIKNK